jgi:glycosyltransferase involved in cell wall biosynthesis
MYHSDFLGGLAAYFSGVKNIIWGIHRTSLSWSDSKSTLLIMKLCALMSRWLPKKIIPVAQAGRTAHIEAGYDAEKMEVIPNGFDFSKLTATQSQRTAFRAACGFSDDDLVIGCLGRFHQVKGQDNFVKAAAITLNKQPSANLKFLMVGDECDANNNLLMDWINEYPGLKEKMVLLGNRNDVPVCLSGMDIFCMPSRTECFPLCLGEAMAMGLPCVGTDVGDAGYLAGGTVSLVPPQNENAMAEALLKVIALTESERGEMGAKGKARVLSEFTIESVGERYDAVYREVLTGSKTLCAA